VTVKLYRCITPTDRLCACGKVHRGLVEVGIDVDVERVPLSSKPGKRPEIVKLTGQPRVPVIVEADGTATHDSKTIVVGIKAGQVQG